MSDNLAAKAGSRRSRDIRFAQDLAEGGQEAVVLGRGAVADADVPGAAEGRAGADGDLALGEAGDHLVLVGLAEVDPGEVGLGLGGGDAELAQALLDPDALDDGALDAGGDVVLGCRIASAAAA